MAKIDTLKLKYPTIGEYSLSKLNELDRTPTKKYLEYMIKTWLAEFETIVDIEELGRQVAKFDELLPYVDKKDIYTDDYSTFEKLTKVVSDAEIKKKGKTFVKDKNIEMLYETDEYLFLIPKTHEGSLKYGAGTRWCTASRDSPETFRKYYEKGYLGYLIDKKSSKKSGYNKVAMHITKDVSPYFGKITLYIENDNEVTQENVLLDNGWDLDLIIKLTNTFRKYCSDYENMSTAILNIDTLIEYLEDIDIDVMIKHLKSVQINNPGVFEEKHEKLMATANEFQKKLADVI